MHLVSVFELNFPLKADDRPPQRVQRDQLCTLGTGIAIPGMYRVGGIDGGAESHANYSSAGAVHLKKTCTPVTVARKSRSRIVVAVVQHVCVR